jgi:predicted nucleic acid-binding protein
LIAALDTNILAYLEGTEDEDKRRRAVAMLGRIRSEQLVVPVQVLGELFNVLTRKRNRPAAVAREAVMQWVDTMTITPTTVTAIARAVDLVVDHRLSTWDAVILAAAAEAGCRVLLSEDMQHGFTWSGVTVVNPFAEPPHPLLEDLLA